jgi:hypothetical protein
MSLEFPHEFRTSTSFEGNVSDKNLRILVKATKKREVLTEVAGQAYIEFQKAKVSSLRSSRRRRHLLDVAYIY